MLHRQAFSSLPTAPGPSLRLTTFSEGGGLSSADVQGRWGRLHLGPGANSFKSYMLGPEVLQSRLNMEPERKVVPSAHIRTSIWVTLESTEGN